MPIEIGVTQEYIICPNCKKKLSLKYVESVKQVEKQRCATNSWKLL